ncbi:hypothetical protein N0V84_000837 [Fusarium piperis]|uniref:Uncharacterized protein n=1 Tax=Fusarium piperis TaxID=1435070 RepID=A0A9W8WM36_9HYPO|nr:hypothetical protein N0V84_000837 [Fusarium piperis]
MKSVQFLSVFGALLGSVVVSAETSGQSGVDDVVKPLSDFSSLAVETSNLAENFDFDNAQAEADAIQLTSDFLDLAFNLHLVSIGIDANTKDITKRVLYVAEQWFFGFYYLGDGVLEKLVPLCSREAQANTKKILEEIKVLIRAYGGRTDCSRVGGPLVNLQRTCHAGENDVSELPGGIITKRRTDWRA